MKLHFKPMPWLTVFVALCLAILISLGTWQYQRLQWKTALLEDVEAAVTAPPRKGLDGIEQDLASGAKLDFMRVELQGVVSSGQPYLVYKSRSDGIYWQAFSAIETESWPAFGAFGFVRDDQKENYAIDFLPEGRTKLAGYIRKSHAMGTIESRVKSQANPKTNRYFKFNQTGDWASKLSRAGEFNQSYYIELVEGVSDANELPIKRPDIRNNHLDYMLTWYSFAGILLIIYVILHFRAGRLKFS
jgi:surfeit locus 1 family protein